MRILIVEDEPRIRQYLKQLFEGQNYLVDVAGDAEEGMYYGEEYPIDLAIIDLNLPRIDGITLIENLRKKHKTFPIIIVTGRDQWQEKVRGLEAGADDYMVKPFVAEELIARVEAMLRRVQGFRKEEIIAGPLHVNTLSQEVMMQGKRVDLTAYEYKLLDYFLQNTGKPISKITLTEHLYAQDFERDSNVIEVLVGRLRRKLDPDNTLNMIETIRGRGYRFNLK